MLARSLRTARRRNVRVFRPCFVIAVRDFMFASRKPFSKPNSELESVHENSLDMTGLHRSIRKVELRLKLEQEVRSPIAVTSTIPNISYEHNFTRTSILPSFDYFLTTLQWPSLRGRIWPARHHCRPTIVRGWHPLPDRKESDCKFLAIFGFAMPLRSGYWAKLIDEIPHLLQSLMDAVLLSQQRFSGEAGG